MRTDFLKNVENHTINVIIDNGINRHIEFSNNGSYHYKFGLVTWAGYLCVYGDMGEWVFARTDDMFQFFNVEKPNYRYWSEKLQATYIRGGHEEFDFEKFKSEVMLFIDQMDLSDEKKQEIKDDVLWDFKWKIDEKDVVCFNYIHDYDFEGKSVFKNFFDDAPSFRKYTYHYLWICEALVWAIKQYKEHKLKQAA